MKTNRTNIKTCAGNHRIDFSKYHTIRTYATTPTATTPNNKTSFDNIGNGQTPSEEDIRN